MFNNITLLEMSAADQDAAAQMFANQDMGEDLTPSFVAPGDEVFTLSHGDGEHEAFKDLAQQVADAHGMYVNVHQQNSTFHVQSFGRSHKQSSFYTQTRYVKGLFLVQRRSGEIFR